MITLSLPSNDNEPYLDFGDFLIGPFRPEGSPSNDISYRSKWDQLQQGGRAFYESNVDHLQFEASLTYSPLLATAVPIPTPDFPDRCSYYIKRYTGAPMLRTFIGGLVSNTGYTFLKKSVSHSAVLRSGNQVTLYSFEDWAYCYKSVYTIEEITNSYVKYRRDHEVVTWPSTTGVKYNLRTRLTYGQFVACVETILSTNKTTVTNNIKEQMDSWFPTTKSSLDVQTARHGIDSFLYSMGTDEIGSLSPRDYGELAMEAVQTVDANNVNMFAFLRDIRHPLEMIPKLKNLASIKDLSGDYLAIKYGVLPTISDLKEIFEAFKKALPYRDRFGYSLYTAHHHDEVSTNLMSVALDQRIKIAIADEDSEFLSLLDRLSDIGFDPTLVNVWDLIPYSFVLDWFIDVGGLLERIDTRLRILRLDIRYATMSRKYRRSQDFPTSPELPFVGPVDLVRYTRWTQDQCPVPALSASSTGNPLNHWLEGGALIAQRIKTK